MIIVGDCAYPKNDLKFNNEFDEYLLVNCEGYLIEGEDIEHQGVYNHIDSLKSINNGKVIFGLANNHIMDSSTGVVDSVEITTKNGIPTVGAGTNLDDSKSALVVNENGVEVAIIAAGWDVIGCKPAKSNMQGVMPLKEDLLLPEVESQKKLGRKVVVYLHWGYELEVYPQPTHREMAKTLIDAGCDIVLGCHAHCLQGVEQYKGKFIFYGLGNSIFKENFFYDGVVKFPDFCKKGIAVKFNVESGLVEVADISLNDENVHISNFGSPEKHLKLSELSSFQSFSNSQYISFFKENRRKKNLLPIFLERDNTVTYDLKRLFVILRSKLILFLFKMKIKGSAS